ncbi:MAG TPA: A24 family peptidase [Terriglobales bacterium]|jgi:prepilin peptidase CpaA|nr:A24 family peptidase [Terriglobales bacterium]
MTTILSAAVLGHRWGVPHPEVWNALILAFVVTAAVGDIRWRKIPRLLTTAAVAAGLIFHLVHGGLGWEFASALIATLIAFGVGLSFFQLGAIGGGDVKLITALGALLGLDRWIVAMEVAVLAAALIGIVQAVRRGTLGQMLRNIGSLLKWLAGRGGMTAHPTINVRNTTMLRAPFGVAAALGTLFAVFKP